MIAIGGGLPAGTTVAVGDGELSIPLWSLTVDAVGLTPSTIEPLGALIELVSGPNVADPEIEIPAVDSTQGDCMPHHWTPR